MIEECGIVFCSEELPGLYQSADKASLDAQKQYLLSLKAYTFFLIVASIVAFYSTDSASTAIASAIFFLISVGITIWLYINKPENIWYNGRAVAESVKTRSWRWMMKAEPYDGNADIKIASREFIADLKMMLEQNRSLGDSIGFESSTTDAISQKMLLVRSLPYKERSNFYKKHRVDEQALWYWKKTKFNKKNAAFWFWVMITLHGLAIFLLLYKIKSPDIKLPIGVIALCASSALSWLQTKKHNELSASYALAAQEISLIRGESAYIDSEESLSDFVINSENAFSREHTQWFARKKE
jgi:SMODS and SLOG-associating 2TM effector domain 3/SMODS and SLOG-associating 2TM effector domain 1